MVIRSLSTLVAQQKMGQLRLVEDEVIVARLLAWSMAATNVHDNLFKCFPPLLPLYDV